MGLVGAQHNVRVQMSRVMIAMIQRKIALRVKDCGLVEVGVEACPNESIEALEKVGQVSWRRVGLLRLHAFQAERQTRREERIGQESQRREECACAPNQLMSLTPRDLRVWSLYSFYIHYTRP
jgi:hypothetical protein